MQYMSCYIKNAQLVLLFDVQRLFRLSKKVSNSAKIDRRNFYACSQFKVTLEFKIWFLKIFIDSKRVLFKKGKILSHSHRAKEELDISIVLNNL